MCKASWCALHVPHSLEGVVPESHIARECDKRVVFCVFLSILVEVCCGTRSRHYHQTLTPHATDILSKNISEM